MREELSREKMHKAIDSAFSGLNGDPWLFQRVSARAAEGEIRVKKKLSAGLVLAIVLVLLAAAALAVTLLTHKEIVEQVAVPLALENDTETPGVNRFFSAEDLSEIIRSLNENGIELDETNYVMQLLQSGQGYYEDEVISDILYDSFGFYISTWTLEQQDWYSQLQYKLGLFESYQCNLPGNDNLTYEEAEAFAFRKIREEYGMELSLEDRSVWRLFRTFQKKNESVPEDTWYFNLEAKDLEHASYRVEFNDRNPAESTETGMTPPPDWTKPYTGYDLMDWFGDAYTYLENKWPQSVWQALHERMLNAELDPDSWRYPEHRGYQLTAYPDPQESDISREEAIRIAKTTLNLEKASLNSAVLTEYDGERTWLVCLVIRAASVSDYSIHDEKYVITIDSASGEIHSLRKAEDDDLSFIAYVPEIPYEKAMSGLLRKKDCIPLAAEAIRNTYPELDPADENEFKIAPYYYWNRSSPEITFITQNPRHGNASVCFNPDGTVSGTFADLSPLTGRNIFSRYREVYGSEEQWNQTVWVQLGQNMQKLEPEGIESSILKATRYPEESSVKIRHKEAQELGIQAFGKRTAEVFTCVLVDAQPHPVWILNIMTYGSDYAILGIDAETGELVFTEPNVINFTPQYVSYSMPETWRRMELEAGGAPYAARMAIGRKFYEQDYDVSDFLFRYWHEYWNLRVDGLTVRYISRWKGRMDYEVELDANGNVLRCEETESAAKDEKPESRADGKPWIWGNTFASESYWTQLEKVMTNHRASFDNLHVFVADWLNQYGPLNEETWPSDLYALTYVLTELELSDLSAGSVFCPEIYPRTGQIQRKEALEISIRAIDERLKPVFGEDWADQFWFGCLSQSADAYTDYLVLPYSDVWVTWFSHLHDEDVYGKVLLDEAGNVIYTEVFPYDFNILY